MKRRRKKRSTNATAPRDLLARGRGRGTEMTITVDAELLKTLDVFRHEVAELTGVELPRRAVLEGLLRRVWRDKFDEAAAIGASGIEERTNAIRGK
jgi:hypothetical protein